MPDAVFSDPRLAEIYDPLDPDRSDLAPYVAMADALGARSALDIGCGTGTLACLLAGRGVEVTAVDPAGASLDVARRKPGADRVRWLSGDVGVLPPLQVDLVAMTANVAQVFVTDRSWAATLSAARQALTPEGRLVFEARDPAAEAWRHWTRHESHRIVDLAGPGPVETWTELTAVEPPLVSFRQTFAFHASGTVLTSDSTLIFRSRDELGESVLAAGFTVEDVRDAPDRLGLELVVVAAPAIVATSRRV